MQFLSQSAQLLHTCYVDQMMIPCQVSTFSEFSCSAFQLQGLLKKRTDPVHRSSHTRWGLGRDYRNLVLPLLRCNAKRLVRTQDLLAQVGRTSPLRQACPLCSDLICIKHCCALETWSSDYFHRYLCFQLFSVML